MTARWDDKVQRTHRETLLWLMVLNSWFANN